MKTLKKIVLGRRISPNEMDALKGGVMSDINEASYCNCSGSTNGSGSCSNNTNKEAECTCKGNNSNTNTGIGCTCGS